MNRRTLLSGVLALPLAACSNSYSDLPIATAGSTDRYTLGPGDSIKVAVYGFDAMAGSYTVSDAGTISLPMLSTLRVVGKSAPELETEIAGVLRTRDLAPNANVSVQVEKYRPFFILGQVQRPGQYPYVPGMTVLTAVAIAGGYTFRAEKGVVLVNRSNGGATSKARLNADSVIMPGDTIEIPEAWF
ncbi:polysaccharide biosynthesis/export family protein [Sphingomonas sp.]|uniref:polysaccharide biosynthesis/export family protein n=1 Tax=Sphingomonas sp. TaxID=28214 RepID=UPI002ED7A249